MALQLCWDQDAEFVMLLEDVQIHFEVTMVFDTEFTGHNLVTTGVPRVSHIHVCM